MREECYDRIWYKFAQELLPSVSTLKQKVVIDVGCGACEFAQILRKKGYIVTCLDIDPDNVARAHQLGFEAFVVDLNSRLPFKENQFDGATMLDVIEHVIHAEDLMCGLSSMTFDRTLRTA